MALFKLGLLMSAHVAVYTNGLQSSLTSSPYHSSADTPGDVQRMPWHGKVAVIIRGQPFRGRARERGCKSECRESQLNASRSVVSRLIEPLEQVRKNSVDVFNVNCGDHPCELFADVSSVLSANQTETTRHIRSTFVNSNVEGGQAICVQRALDFLEASADASSYDAIIMTRHDVEWLDSIFSWSGADFTGINFFSRCQAGALNKSNDGIDGPSACVHDVLQVVPGRLFSAWRTQIGKGRCFNSDWKKGNGHYCWKQAVLAAGGEENVHLATPWFPTYGVRDESVFLRMKRCNHDPPKKDLHSDFFAAIGSLK
eukprot:TRINITY_DN935_c0_g1_i1.p1 TRINITY_DN935_c0_g1~~TRINITY_DN935_c0_g1_i1.p1  ORF type:complete len:326 (-),score=31.59 TRINITY_DN935_c0_g1_i1:172-1110(-)